MREKISEPVIKNRFGRQVLINVIIIAPERQVRPELEVRRWFLSEARLMTESAALYREYL